MDEQFRIEQKIKVQRTFERRLEMAMTELRKYCITSDFDDNQKAFVLAYAGFIKEKLLEIIADEF